MANDNTRPDGSLSEEASASGQRVKVVVKDGAGDEALERDGDAPARAAAAGLCHRRW